MKVLNAWSIGLTTAIFVTCIAGSNVTTTYADDLDTIKERGVVRGVVANEQPYGFIDTTGKAAGIGPEIATAVLRKLGIDKIEWTVVAFDGLIPGIKANRFDFSAAEQAIRPARCKQVVFSVPTSSYTAGLLVKKGNPKNLHGLEDVVRQPGIKLAIVAGAVELLPDAYKIPREDRVYIQSNADSISALGSDRTDAYLATELTIAGLAKLSGDVEAAKMTADPVLDGKPYRNFGGFTFRPEDKKFIAAFNAALSEFKKTNDYAAILRTYGLTDQSIEAARASSTESLCNGG